MGPGRHGQGGGALAGNVVVFCALAVTVKRSVEQLFMHYFYNFLKGRTGSFSSFGLCFEGDY